MIGPSLKGVSRSMRCKEASQFQPVVPEQSWLTLHTPRSVADTNPAKFIASEHVKTRKLVMKGEMTLEGVLRGYSRMGKLESAE